MALPVPARISADDFERALQLASRGQDVTAVADAMSTLQNIVALGSQPEGTLDRVVEVARERMSTTDSAMVWQVAVQLALATRDPRLRAMIAAVATGTAEPRFSQRHQLRLWVRSAAQRALTRKTGR